MNRALLGGLAALAVSACHPEYEKMEGISTEFSADGEGQVTAVTVALDLEVIRTLDHPAEAMVDRLVFEIVAELEQPSGQQGQCESQRYGAAAWCEFVASPQHDGGRGQHERHVDRGLL